MAADRSGDGYVNEAPGNRQRPAMRRPLPNHPDTPAKVAIATKPAALRTEPTRVALVQNDAAVRATWNRMLEAAEGFQCVCACGTAEEALGQVPGGQPDVILVDLDLPNASGVDCAAGLKTLLPQAQLLMLTPNASHTGILPSLRAGAIGFVLTAARFDELLAAISEARNGGSPMTREIARRLVEAFHQSPSATAWEGLLSSREHQILDLLTDGLSNKELSERLHISFDTVRTHLKHIYAKLNVRSRAEAVGRHLRQGPASMISHAGAPDQSARAGSKN